MKEKSGQQMIGFLATFHPSVEPTAEGRQRAADALKKVCGSHGSCDSIKITTVSAGYILGWIEKNFFLEKFSDKKIPHELSSLIGRLHKDHSTD